MFTTALITIKSKVAGSLITLLALMLVISLPFESAFAKSRTRVIHLSPNFGKPLRLTEKAATLAIGDPNIADIVTVEPDLLMITGQKNGSTSLTVIGRSGNIYQYTLLVANDVTQLRTLVHSVAPDVSVHSIKNRILLKGTVDTAAQLTRVLTLADRYMGGKDSKPHFQVISDQGGVLAGDLNENNGQFVSEANINVNNVSSGGGGRGQRAGANGGGGGQGGRGQGSGNGKANLAQNIARASVVSVAEGRIVSMIKVLNQPKVEIQMRIVEIDRTKTDEFGIDWRLDGTDVSISSKAGDVQSSTGNAINGLGDVTLDGAELFGAIRNSARTIGLSVFVNAMEVKGATTTLSEPLLTALSGEASQFLVGGSVPIPTQEATTSQLGAAAVTTNVEYINFGLGLTVRPTVLENGKINIVLNQSISSPDYGNAIQILGAQVPGFQQKTISTVTESDNGETWAVAGLLTEEDRRRLQSVPWISKVPILGNIFKNKNDAVSRNEMIILVNARRVDKPNSTTTNFNNEGLLSPKNTTLDQHEDVGHELDSQLPYIPSKKNNQSKRKQQIKPENNAEPTLKQGAEDSKVPVYESFKGKRMNHAYEPTNNRFKELNSDLGEQVAVIYLKEKYKPTEIYKVEETDQNREAIVFNELNIPSNDGAEHANNIGVVDNDLSIAFEPTNQKRSIEANNTGDFKVSQLEQDSMNEKDLLASSSPVQLNTTKILANTVKPNTLINDFAIIEAHPQAAIAENIRGIKITMEDSKGPQHDKVILHNFLVGKEKLAFLSKSTALTGDININDAIKQWKVATGSKVSDPSQQITFLVKNNTESRLYSGAQLTVQTSSAYQQMVADDYNVMN